MIGIRRKLMIYFTVVVVLLAGLSLFLYQSGQNTTEKQDQRFQRFLLLNDISKKTDRVYENLNAYMVEKKPSYLEAYKTEKDELVPMSETLIREIEYPDNAMTLKNYQNMIRSFIEESEITLEAFHDQEIDVYSAHLDNVRKTSSFIQETTLTLINDELNRYQQDYAVLQDRNRLFNYMVFSIFGAVLVFSTLIALWLSRGITGPLRQLSVAAREIAGGYLHGRDVKVHTKDEFRDVAAAFNQMRHNIRHLIVEIQEKSELDRLLKEMELKSLQTQINPHFLFNTLNTVAKSAYIEEADRTQKLIDSISALLRHNLGNLEKPTTLGDELRIVREYFFIQQTRFGERIQFIHDVDDACLSQPIPPLTLQPLVENAFIHGIESSEEGGVLSLYVRSKTGDVVVEVTDNGAGMDEKVRKQLLLSGQSQAAAAVENVKQDKGHSTGLGLHNVMRRLELFYGQSHLMDIDSQRGKGTTVRLRLPKEIPGRKEVVGFENHDRG